MTTVKILRAFGLVGLVVSPPASAQERFRAGKWEIVFTGENPHTSTTCLTDAMTRGMNGPVAAVRADIEKTAAERKYTIKGYKFDGTTISFTALGAARSFVSTASYHGDTFESLTITKIGGKEHTTGQKGRRIGNCP